MGAVLALQTVECEISAVNWEQWFLKGAEKLKEMVKNLATVVDRGGTLQEMSESLWKHAPDILSPILEAALQDKANSMTDSVPCPRCGKECKPSRRFPRQLETRSGSVTIERPYHSCRDCKAGFFPFDALVGLTSDRKQADLQRAALELFTEVPYETASDLFMSLTGMSFSDHAMHDLSCDMGADLEMADALPSAESVQELIDEQSRPGAWKPVLVISSDGAHVPTRPEAESRSAPRGAGEWREAKGFRMYLASHDRIIQVMSWHQIANEEQFGKDLHQAAALIPQADVRIALVGDGAPWIWKHMTSAFPDGQEILDYYHCKEHIHKVANLQYVDDEAKRQAWIESTMGRLHFGEVESVRWGLQRMKPSGSEAGKEIEKLITYLGNNSHRIDYAAAKKRQFPCGSGGIESANKAICHTRLKRSGAWWIEENANTLLALRCAKCNGTLDSLYKKYLGRRRSARRQGAATVEKS